MRDEADLDALITRIQSDLRAGRSPGSTRTAERDGRFRTELRRIRGRSLRRSDVAHLVARWLVPVMIFATVLIATLLFDRP